MLPARGKDPNRGLYVVLHPSLSIEACFEAGHRCPAEEQGPRWVKKDVKIFYVFLPAQASEAAALVKEWQLSILLFLFFFFTTLVNSSGTT